MFRIGCSFLHQNLTKTVLKMSKKTDLYRNLSIPPSVKVTVLGTVNKNGLRSVIVDTNQISYLINCGEGTTRVVNEAKGLKLGSIRHILFTRDSWENVSGLQGLAISLNASGVDCLTLHANKPIMDLVLMQKRFLDSASCRISRNNINDKPFSDIAFTIHSIPISLNSKIQEPESKVPRLETNFEEKCYALLFKSAMPPAKISVSKCKEVGIPDSVIKSRVMGNFKNNLPVQLDDGRVIQPEQVLVYPDCHKPFLILECPSEDYISSYLESPELQALCKGSGNDQLDVVVHLSPPWVTSSPQYKDLINMFAKSSSDFTTQQLLVNSTEGCYSTFKFFHAHVVRHDFLDPLMFPISQLSLPQHTDNNTNDDVTIKNANIRTDLPAVVNGEPLMMFCTRPTRGFDLSLCNRMSKDQILQSHQDNVEHEIIYEWSTISNAFNELKQKLQDLPNDRESRPYPRITFLGTGSAYSSSFRNSSGILFELNSSSCLLIDCGEGTFNQIETLFGSERTTEILANLKMICITHLHLDHHAGLYTILHHREHIRKEYESRGIDISSVGVLAPIALTRIGPSYDELFNTDVFQRNEVFRLTALCNNKNVLFCQFNWYSDYATVLNNLDIQLRPVFVNHTSNSYAFVFSGSSLDTRRNEMLPWKIVFSGDCRPTPALVDFGKDCDLLIHEATFEDGMENMAAMKKHSTVSEAVNVGREMKARHTILTHFSQRYAKLPYITKVYPNVGTAFDLLQVTLNELPRLEAMLPYLQYLHPNDWLQMESRTLKRGYSEMRRLEETPSLDDCDLENSDKKSKSRISSGDS